MNYAMFTKHIDRMDDRLSLERFIKTIVKMAVFCSNNLDIKCKWQFHAHAHDVMEVLLKRLCSSAWHFGCSLLRVCTDIDIDFDSMYSMSKKWTLKLNAMSMFFKISTLNSIQCFQCFNVDFNVAMLQFFQILSTFSNSRKFQRKQMLSPMLGFLFLI